MGRTTDGGHSARYGRSGGLSPRGHCALALALTLVASMALLIGAGLTRSTPAVAAPPLSVHELLISEFRTEGPGGDEDEYVEIYNPADFTVNVAAEDQSAGWSVATSAGQLFIIPNGEQIPARGHYLVVNLDGYSLNGYPGGSGLTAVGDRSFLTDIPHNAGLALFSTANTASYGNPAFRKDAVGATTEPDATYREGAGYQPVTGGFSTDHAWYRDERSGVPVDTGDNAADFVFGDVNGTSSGPAQLLGAPGPRNKFAPVIDNATLPVTLLDPSTRDNLAPNFVRDSTSDPGNNSDLGTVALRRTVTNNTGAPVTRLRFRITGISTFPAPGGVADLRARTSSGGVVLIGATPHTVLGTTLEEPPGQVNGGAGNSTLSVDSITTGAPLADGASVDVELLFGVQQTGSMQVDLNVEALPAAGAAGNPVLFSCTSTDPTGPGACVNAAPVANPDAYSTAEDTPLTVNAPGLLANDTDVDADPITADKVTDPAHGSVTVNADGSFTYTPAANYFGPDSFTYAASDPATTSGTATVSLTVDPVNDAPTATDDAYPATEDTTLTVTAPGVLNNDSDVDGDILTASKLTDPAHGAVTLNSDGSFDYVPAANFHGTDSFTYQAIDPVAGLDGPSGQASPTATVTITVAAANDAPVAVADTYEIIEDTARTVTAPGVLENDTDIDGDPLTAQLTTAPAHGVLVLNADGSFTYTPAADYTGPDSFGYQAFDGAAASAPIAVTLTVSADNDAPVGAADAYATDEDTLLTVPAPGVLGNDTDAEGHPLTAGAVTQPAHGALLVAADGSFRYAPAADFNGADAFTYRPNDGTTDGAPVRVTITVTAVTDPVTVATAQVVVTGGRGSAGTTLDLAGLVDNPDGTPFRLIAHSNGLHGTVTCAGTVCRYVPEPDFTGVDAFTYTLRTAAGQTLTGTVRITVVGGTAALLPDTGANPRTAIRLGLALLLAGAALLVAATTVRRRRPRA
jgi:VCBS repeat-containing protein